MNRECVDIVIGPFEFASAPFWYARTNSLYFVDVFKSEIHRYDPQIDEHKFAKIGNESVAFVVPIEDFHNKYLIGYGRDLAALTWDGHSQEVNNLKILECVDGTPQNRISDGKISPGGILFVGTSGSGHLCSDNLQIGNAGLYAYPHCDAKKMISGISNAGGMTWSKSQKTFYFVDCPEYRVEKYCFNKNACILNHGCVLYEFKDDDLPGFPSGLTTDDEDNLWVGCFNGSRVIKVDTKTGMMTKCIEIPNCPQITSLVFGGENLDTLFITSACTDEQSAENSGYVFKVTESGSRGLCAGTPLRLLGAWKNLRWDNYKNATHPETISRRNCLKYETFVVNISLSLKLEFIKEINN